MRLHQELCYNAGLGRQLFLAQAHMSGSTEQALACGLVSVHLHSFIVSGLLSDASVRGRGFIMHEAEHFLFSTTPRSCHSQSVTLNRSLLASG